MWGLILAEMETTVKTETRTMEMVELRGKMWGSDMAGGPWLSGSGRAKAKDPGGTTGLGFFVQMGAPAWVSGEKELGF